MDLTTYLSDDDSNGQGTLTKMMFTPFLYLQDDYNLSLVEFEVVYIANAATSAASLSKTGGIPAMVTAEASA